MTSLEISKKLNKEHRVIVKLIRNNFALFEKLGSLNYEVIKTKGRPTVNYILNEDHLKLFINKISSTTDLKNACDVLNIDKNSFPIIEVRHEIELKRIIDSIIKAFSNTSILELKALSQYSVGKYNIDIVIESEIDDKYVPIIAIEIDEELTHKYTKEKDNKRINEIKSILYEKYVKDDYQMCKFVIVNTNDIYKGIQEIVEILNSDFLNVL